MFWTKLKHSCIWERILYERVTEPIHLNLFSINETRKISPYKFLKTKRIFKNASWLDHIYILHILDHTIRQDVKSSRSNVTLVNPYLSN